MALSEDGRGAPGRASAAGLAGRSEAPSRCLTTSSSPSPARVFPPGRVHAGQQANGGRRRATRSPPPSSSCRSASLQPGAARTRPRSKRCKLAGQTKPSPSPATASASSSTRPTARSPTRSRRRQRAGPRRRPAAPPLAGPAPQRRHVGLHRVGAYGLDNLNSMSTSITATQAGPNSVRVEAEIKAEGKAGFVLHAHRRLHDLGRRRDRRGQRREVRGPADSAGAARRAVAARQAARPVRLSSAAVRWKTTPTASVAPTSASTHQGRASNDALRQADGMRQPRGRPLGRPDRHGLPGLIAQADGDLLQASALPYTDEQMTPVEYKIDLPASKATVLCLRARRWASAPAVAARGRWTSTSSGPSRPGSPTFCVSCRLDNSPRPSWAAFRSRRRGTRDQSYRSAEPPSIIAPRRFALRNSRWG